MTDKDVVIKEKVEHSGLFDFGGFYSFAHSWFKEEKYGVDEVKYSEKAEGDKRSIDIQWRVTRTLSDYFKIEHKVVFEIKDLVEVEVEIDGNKKKMNKGRVKVEITGALVKDPDSKWDKSPFSRFMRDVYNKYVIPSRVNDMRFKVSGDVQNFKEELKAFLELVGRR